MKLGVCYYPEHWTQERWSIDAALMRQAGLSLVRLADFAWALMEPREGEFTWDWLDRAIDTLAAEGLQVVLCTPTASPPPWLCRLHPEILPVDVEGRRKRPGSRRHYCPSSEIYRRYTVRIVENMASRYGKHPAVAGWQIDNEFGCHDTARCYCDSCAAAFRDWLSRRYKTVAALNEAWGTVFWSQVYNDWSEIDPPNLTVADPNPSHVLDYDRFSSDAFLGYQQLQIDTVRPYISSSQVVTTNFMAQFTDLDYYDLAAPLDLVAMSSYPTGHAEARASIYMPGSSLPALAYDAGDPYITSLGHTLMRGFKPAKRFWIMEQQGGNINWGRYNTGIRPGAVRLWTWHALASGAEAALYFRWRAGLFAQEQFHSGLLHHDASPDVGFNDLKSMERERALMAEIASHPVESQVALLLDYDSVWALRLQPHHHGFDYIRHLFVYFLALHRLGIPVDIVSPESDLGAYKLVIAPSAFLASGTLAQSLQVFAGSGGTLVLGVRSGMKDGSNRVVPDPLPGPFRDLVGAAVKEWHSLPPGITWDLDSSIPDLAGSAAVWAEALDPALGSSRVLARYTSGPFKGSAALVEREVGAGRALYLGWVPSGEQAQALLSHLASQAGIQPIAQVPEGVVVSRRGPYTILLNFTDHPQIAAVQGKSVDVAPRSIEVIKA